MSMGDSEKKLDFSIVKENRLIRFAVITLSVYLFFRFIFPLTAPFFFAFILITLFYPLLQRIQKKIPMRKKFLAFGVLFLVLLFLAAILWALGYSGGGQLDKVSVFMEMAYERLQGFLHQCCYSLDGKFGWDGYEIENFVIEKMTIIMENVQVQVIPQVLSSSYSCFKAIFEAVAFLFISFLAAILLEKDYALFLTWLKGSEDMTFIFKALEGILEYIITFLKARHTIDYQRIQQCSAVGDGNLRRRFLGDSGGMPGCPAIYRDRRCFGANGHLAVPDRKIYSDGRLYCSLYSLYFYPGISGTEADRQQNGHCTRVNAAWNLCGYPVIRCDRHYRRAACFDRDSRTDESMRAKETAFDGRAENDL